MRRGSLARQRRPCALLLLAALWAAPALGAPEAAAAVAPSAIVIEVRQRSDLLLEEAVLRVQGELGAMGLEAHLSNSDSEPRGATDPGTTQTSGGRLTLEREGNVVRITALGPSSPQPFVQELDARGRDVTAEVVAVRAVEALRAVMTLPQRRGETAEPEPVPGPPPPPPVPPAPTSTLRPSMAPREQSALGLWSGVQGFVDPGLEEPGLSGELGLFWGRSALFVGVSGSLTLIDASLSASEGDVHIRRANALARFGYVLPFGGPFEASFAAGAGWSRYMVQGRANAGYVGTSSHSDTPLLLLGAGANAWFAQHFAVYLRFDATLATNAAAVRANYRELSVLERPTLWGSFGLVARLPLAR